MITDYWQAMNTKIEEELSNAAGDAIAPDWDVSISGYFQSMVRIAHEHHPILQVSHIRLPHIAHYCERFVGS